MDLLILLLFLLAVAAFIGVAVLIVKASLKAKRTRHAAWSRLGESLGLVAGPLPEGHFALMNHRNRLSGALHGQAFHMEEVLRGHGVRRQGSVELGTLRISTSSSQRHHRHRANDNQGLGLAVSLQTAPYLSAQLQVSKENVLHRVARPLMKEEAQLGDEALDQALFFTELPDGDREVLLRPEIRTLLLRLCSVGAGLKLHGGTLELDFARVPKDEKIEELVLDLASLVEALTAERRGHGARW